MQIQRKLSILGAAMVIGAVSACGGGGESGNSPVTAPPSSSMKVDTAAILAQAEQPSETAQPYAVNNAAIIFTDTSETAAPIAVTGTQ
jgi:hypothetical protein